MNFKIKFLKNLKKKDYKYKNFLNKAQVNEINFSEYLQIFKNNKFREFSHTQSPGYYLANDDAKYLKVTEEEKLLAIVSVVKKRFFLNFLCVARINNGPLIIEEFSKRKYYILEIIKRFITKKYSRVFSLSPSYLFKNRRAISSYNYIKLGNESFGTYVLNLSQSEDYIFRNLKSNWRNGLKKGSKHTIVSEVFDKKTINSILKEYENYAINNGFKPVTYKKCMAWFGNSRDNKNLLNLKIYQSFKAEESKKRLGSIGILFFKNKCLYLFGYTNNEGRRYQANVAMLWHSIIQSKKSGFKYFDLGGISSKTKKGILKFKEGLNGELYKSIGEFIYFGIF